MSEIEDLKRRLTLETLEKLQAQNELKEGKLEILRLRDMIQANETLSSGGKSENLSDIFKNVYQIYTDALFIVERHKHVVLSCNEQACQLFGMSDEASMIGNFEQMVFHFPENSSQRHILSEAYRVNILFEGEAEFQNFSGGKFIANVLFKPFQVKGMSFCLVQLSDITEKRKVEKNLLKSQKRYRDLINYSQALICTHDLNGVIMNMNHAALDAIKIREDQVQGMNLLDIIPAKYAADFNQYLQRIADNSSDNGIMILLNREGKKRYLMYQNYKVENDTESPYVVGFAQDISERVMMERKLKKAIALAEASVNARKIFLANMSHEMRTPLNGILGMAGLLAKTPLDPRQSGFLSIIKNSADNLLIIINDILDIAKIESGKLQLEEITFDISDTIRNCVRSLIYKAEEKGLSIHALVLEGEVNIVQGDPYRFNQILLNLLNNSLKFTNVGYVEISYALASEQEGVIVFQFHVKDTGIGIAAEKLDKIFDGFTQADPDTTRKYGGTGLGLNICKNLLQLQGGSIEVKSQPNHGSEFIFTIPYKKGDAKNLIRKVSPRIDVPALGPLKILLVEDNEVNQYLAQSIMQDWGLEVVSAYNGVEALEKLSVQDFNLILMDIHMPEMDGLETTRIIRKLKDKTKSNLPIIAITADALKGDEEKYFSVGMNDYMTKPFSEEILFYKILNNAVLLQSTGNSDTVKKKDEKVLTVSAPLYDLSQIASASHGNAETIRKMILVFLESTTKIIAQMEQNFASNNIDQVKQLAHKLKTSIDTLGITVLKKEVRWIELYKDSDGGPEVLFRNITYLKKTMEIVVDQLSNQFNISIVY
jgi:PAS domain S-box-containing protein